ncbi:MAG: hypothetical protein GH143_04500 [Calditrichaeota bacterium]|nr:hypothetical protein [Calditrichota bacterium]
MSEKLPFYQRFDIILNQDEAREKFVNRAYHAFFADLCPAKYSWCLDKIRSIGAKLGTSDKLTYNARDLIGMDFGNCLSAIEALYADAKDQVSKGDIDKSDIDTQHYIERKLKEIFHESEHDIGIEWRAGQFWRTGAKILDEKLVNKNLKWLLDKGHTNIYEPFDKALLHYSESIKHPEKLRDVITDMYEALEATAIIVNNNDKDLSANAEKFIANLKLSGQHKEMLKAYIDYANKIARHAQSPKSKRIEVSNSEAENFIYLTGIFIRFAIQKLDEQGLPLMAD